jgi:hypothetical protein
MENPPTPVTMRSMPRHPVVLLSYFTLRDLGALLDAVRRSGVGDRATLHIGSYGVNPRAAAAMHEDRLQDRRLQGPFERITRVRAPGTRSMRPLICARRASLFRIGSAS